MSNEKTASTGPQDSQPVGSGLVTYRREDRIAYLELNRPEKLNAFTDDMVRELAQALQRFDTDPQAWVAILSGNGRAFSSGADVHQRQLRPIEEMRRMGGPQAFDAQGSDLMVRSVNWKPVIAAVHGYAIGMALGLALESDLLVASEETKFQVTETRRGLAAARYWALLRYRSTAAFADEVALTGRFFGATEAGRHGVVTRVAAEGEHLNQARELAEAIVQNPPLSVRATVRTRRWYMEQAEREAYLQTNPLKLHLTEDFRRSARAFAEKRAPEQFEGR